MNLTVIALVAVATLLTIGLVAYMLNRAWGDFPRRLMPSDYAEPSQPSLPTSAWGSASAPADHEDDMDSLPLPAGAPADSLILVAHPQVRQVVTRALEHGGSPYATYFIRDGERIYLAAYRIADPLQRAQAIRIFKGLNGGDMSGVNFGEIMRLLQQMSKGGASNA